jgi:anti-sigma factor RsiW
MTAVRLIRERHDNDNSVQEAELQAYVDGLLDSRRRPTIEAYLATHPGEAARLAAYRNQNIGLHALFDPRPDGGDGENDVPNGLVVLAGRLEARLRRSDERRAAMRHLPRLAASLALLLTAGAAGWVALGQAGGGGDPLVAFTGQAAQAPLQPAGITVAATEGEQPVTAWLAAQPDGVPARLPDLESLGFRLAGERLVTTDGGRPAAQLLYRDDAGARVTLTMREGGKAGQAGFSFARDGDTARFLWQDIHMAYSLSGAIAEEKLLKIAEAVSASLRRGPAGIPQQEGARKAPEAPQAPTANPTPAAPAPSLDNVPLIPVPEAETENLAKET